MSDYVVDAAAIVEALTRKDAVGTVIKNRIMESTCIAPHLIDAEVGHVLRRFERLGRITEERALIGLRGLEKMVDERYEHGRWMTSEAWKLRHAVTFYDGLYVALAAKLNLPLLTSDKRLSNAPDLPCAVELIA